MTKNNIGILLTNIGSPDEPTTVAVRSYLKKFLSDRRVVEIPQLLWLPILHGYILRTRPQQSANLYQKIWTDAGSPLKIFSENIALKLATTLALPVEVGMHYGNPSIEAGIDKLRANGVNKLLVLPMYPQYSATTTASTFDYVAAALKKIRDVPEIRMIKSYADDKNYIKAICQSLQGLSINYLLFSFHGIPQRYIDRGDPYAEQCHTTANLIAQELNLAPDAYSIAFQSRLGRAQWLTPYTDKVLAELPQKNCLDVHVICPGFPVDCLETLEEIAIRAEKQFLQAGGKSLSYIPALNDRDEHITALKSLIEKHIQGW